MEWRDLHTELYYEKGSISLTGTVRHTDTTQLSLRTEC